MLLVPGLTVIIIAIADAINHKKVRLAPTAESVSFEEDRRKRPIALYFLKAHFKSNNGM